MPFVPNLPSFNTDCVVLYCPLQDGVYNELFSDTPFQIVVEAVKRSNHILSVPYLLPEVLPPSFSFYQQAADYGLFPLSVGFSRASMDPAYFVSSNTYLSVVYFNDPGRDLNVGYWITGMEIRYNTFPNSHYLVTLTRMSDSTLNQVLATVP